ncbi:MAG: hypothetical protein GXX96_13215 [Planctomycetaceae bacterium]|nr:hypothetical protein [Planctomycetaceae bacterium]
MTATRRMIQPPIQRGTPDLSVRLAALQYRQAFDRIVLTLADTSPSSLAGTTKQIDFRRPT